MAYKHKETGEIYNLNQYSSIGNKIEKTFEPWNPELKAIKIICPKTYDDDNSFIPYEKRCENSKLNNQESDKMVADIFEEISLNPIIDVVDKPKYVEVIVEMKCPLCGKPLVQYGGVLLSAPPQYQHKCSDPNCHYHTTLSRWYAGQKLWAESKEEAYRIITSGTHEEKTLLEERRERRI